MEPDARIEPDISHTGPDVRHMDRRVIIVWIAPVLIAAAIFWFLGSIAYMFMPPDSGAFGISKSIFPFVFLFALAIPCLVVYAWLAITYDRFTYELDEKELVVREGVLTRKATVIPYNRIQDITSERNLVERAFGLATIEIETAGSSRVASEKLIPGIANKDALIQEIMAKVQKIKTGSLGGIEEESSKTPQVLEDILKELKAISLKLEPSARVQQKEGNHRQKKGTDYEEYLKYKKKDD